MNVFDTNLLSQAMKLCPAHSGVNGCLLGHQQPMFAARADGASSDLSTGTFDPGGHPMLSKLDTGSDEALEVILVDDQDKEVGSAGKLIAHREALLHRAFSIFVFDSSSRMLVQQRAASKYHSPGLWSNACCGHPVPGEATDSAAYRRLWQELGFDCQLKEAFRFTYSANLGDGMSENEYDHVFLGFSEAEVHPNPREVAAVRWVGLDALAEDVARDSRAYTFWFRHTLDRLLDRATLQIVDSIRDCGMNPKVADRPVGPALLLAPDR